MTFAVLKLSYNDIGDRDLLGGICGTAFFIGKRTALTANHILSRANYKPNVGYGRCQYWLLSRDGRALELNVSALIDYPHLDTTVIRFDDSPAGLTIPQISSSAPSIGEAILNEGYISGGMPSVKPTWGKNSLEITNGDLSALIADQHGFIKNIGRTTIRKNDVNLDSVNVIETSYPGRLGMSGGPLMRQRTREVIGLMSFGLPEDAVIKTTVNAISITEITSEIEMI